MARRLITGSSDRKRLRRRLQAARDTEGKFATGPRVDLSPWQAIAGTVADSKIASAAGVSRSRVQAWRQSLEIPPCRPERRYSAQEDALLLKLPTAQAAKELGVSVRAVTLRKAWTKRK